jgi:diaminohydroxyphosphoribosylaminopyrimidine deaminase/5-amino-6-(5-phosphoribosylamino)uracil reductase
MLKTNPGLKIYNKGSNTLVINYIKEGVEGSVEYIKPEGSKNFLETILNELYRRNILSVIVEGGKKTHNHFIESGLWDEARIINGKVFFKDGLKAPELHRIPNIQYQIGTDRVDTYYNS